LTDFNELNVISSQQTLKFLIITTTKHSLICLFRDWNAYRSIIRNRPRSQNGLDLKMLCNMHDSGIVGESWE